MEKEEYYINKDSCSCSNSPYFLINNLFKELDTEKKKKIARLNLGINDDNIVDIENYMEIELKLPKGIYYYHNNPTISIVANLNSKVINPEILVGENKDYLVFKYYINNDNNIYYACYLNNYFIKKWEDNNAPLEIKQIFNDNLATPTNNGLMSAEDKEKLDNLPDESIVYTKEEINTLLNDKADNSNVYSKIEANNNFATKTELNEKANSSDVYTKRETNVILNTKANIIEVNNEIEAAKTDIRNNTIAPIDDRLSTVEGLAEISIEGGSIQLATKSDFDNPTQEQKDKIPTVNALLEVGLISNKKEESPIGTVVIKPNTLYKFGTCSSLAIAFYSDTSFANAIKEYMFEFTVSGTEFTLTLPEGVRWNETPDLENGYTYQVSIIDNLAVFGEFEPISNE